MLYHSLLLVGILFNVLAQLLLKSSANTLPTGGMVALLTTGFFWLALTAYGLSFLIYTVVLSKLEASRAYPISSIGGIVLLTIISIYLFHESVSPAKITGIIVSCIGIILLFR